MKNSRYFTLALLSSVLSFSVQAQTLTLKPTVQVVAKPIDEMSGIVKSRSRNNTYWVHNDSGDSARIFAINLEGKNIIPTYSKFSFYGEVEEKGKDLWQGFPVLFAENVDWEDMTIDENYLYVADTGNNGNGRRDLGIYMVSEIDPTASTQSASIKYLPIRYPDQENFPATQWHFDSESLFSADGNVYLITKHRVAKTYFTWEAGAKLYRLDTNFSDEDNVLTLIESHAEITAATSAEVSPDGQTLAVLSLTTLWLFDKPSTGDAWLSSSFRKFELDEDSFRQAEAITWIDDETVLITNEQRDMFQVELSKL